MKTIKLLVACIAIFTTVGVSYAQTPGTSPENLSAIIVEKLDADVSLTDKQKTEIRKKAKDFIVKMQEADAIANTDEKVGQKKQYSQDYIAFLESILTDEQKLQLKAKTEERENTQAEQ